MTGLDAKKPKKTCDDAVCPWHGHLKLRGRVFEGIVTSVKPLKTAVVEWDYYYNVKKYERYERRKTRVASHNPDCISAKVGDRVKIAECRPISKTKRFSIVEVIS